MEYRKAVLPDVPGLSRLRVDMLCEGEKFPADFEDLLYRNTERYLTDGIAGNTFSAWVATENEQIIAMGGAAYFELPPNDWYPLGKTAYIGNLYTRPEHRRQGIAARLMELILAEAKERGCRRILLNTSDMARPLYENFGFAASPTAMALYPFGTGPQKI